MQEATIQTLQIQNYNGTSTSMNQNVWIEKCGGPWGSIIVLYAKPHQ